MKYRIVKNLKGGFKVQVQADPFAQWATIDAIPYATLEEAKLAITIAKQQAAANDNPEVVYEELG